MSGPDRGAFGTVDAGAVPAVAAFEVADAAFAASSLFHSAAQGFSMPFGAPRFGRSAFAWDHDVRHAAIGERLAPSEVTAATRWRVWATICRVALGSPLRWLSARGPAAGAGHLASVSCSPRSRSSSARAVGRRSARLALVSSRSASSAAVAAQLGQLAGDPPYGGLGLDSSKEKFHDAAVQRMQFSAVQFKGGFFPLVILMAAVRPAVCDSVSVRLNDYADDRHPYNSLF